MSERTKIELEGGYSVVRDDDGEWYLCDPNGTWVAKFWDDAEKDAKAFAAAMPSAQEQQVGEFVSVKAGGCSKCHQPRMLNSKSLCEKCHEAAALPQGRTPEAVLNGMQPGVTGALADIAAERQRQIDKEGWDREHDDIAHSRGQLGLAAACYAIEAVEPDRFLHRISAPDAVTRLWPWDWSWFKPKDPRRMYVIAGALIVAAIEQLDRAALTKAAEEAGS